MRELTKYRLSVSFEQLQDSKSLLDNNSYKGSLNRSYYSIFTAIRALLAEKEIDYKKHSAVISHFRLNYIKTGVFESKFSDYVGSAFEIRNNSDYADFFIASREDAESQYSNAVEFYEAVKSYLESINDSV